MKTIAQSGQNYEQSISIVPTRYAQGIQMADWKSGVSDPQANTNWKDGVQKAAANDSWKKGVDGVSNEHWKQMAMTKGQSSIAQGMQAGKDKYQQNFAPVLDAIHAAVNSLPPRTTDPMANIDARLKPVAMAAYNARRV